MHPDKMLPRYTSHKTVWALKIAAIKPLPNPDPTGQSVAASYGATMLPADSSYSAFDVPAEYVMRHRPAEGGYFVVYEDGYTSFSPAAAFESGYTPVNGPFVIDPGHRYRLGGAQVLQFLKKAAVPTPVGAPVTHTLEVVAEGTTNEQLIDVLLDRLRFLNAAVPCRENSLAITKLEEAQHWLDARTLARIEQQVEGTAARHHA